MRYNILDILKGCYFMPLIICVKIDYDGPAQKNNGKNMKTMHPDADKICPKTNDRSTKAHKILKNLVSNFHASWFNNS